MINPYNKPLIEDHYHIRELIERQETRTEDRNRHREKEKERAERDKLIEDSQKYGPVDFYCDHCAVDFIALSHKETHTDWTNTDQRIAYYRTVHDCGNWCMRRITDRNGDPYWFDSLKVATDRGTYSNALIQSFETDYNLLYGKK